jgi:hypothetical protein
MPTPYVAGSEPKDQIVDGFAFDLMQKTVTTLGSGGATKANPAGKGMARAKPKL